MKTFEYICKSCGHKHLDHEAIQCCVACSSPNIELIEFEEEDERLDEGDSHPPLFI